MLLKLVICAILLLCLVTNAESRWYPNRPKYRKKTDRERQQERQQQQQMEESIRKQFEEMNKDIIKVMRYVDESIESMNRMNRINYEMREVYQLLNDQMARALAGNPEAYRYKKPLSFTTQQLLDFKFGENDGLDSGIREIIQDMQQGVQLRERMRSARNQTNIENATETDNKAQL